MLLIDIMRLHEDVLTILEALRHSPLSITNLAGKTGKTAEHLVFPLKRAIQDGAVRTQRRGFTLGYEITQTGLRMLSKTP